MTARSLSGIVVALLTAYLLVTAALHQRPGVVPDDVHFLGTAWTRVHGEAIATTGWVKTAVSQRNWEGFGALYWFGLGATGAAGEYRFFVARLASALCLFAIALSAVVIGLKRRDTGAALLALAFWLSMPLAWWCGKVSGVEVPLCAAIAAGCALLLDSPASARKMRVAMFLFGLAAGLKLTGIAALIFGGVYVLQNPEHRRPLRLLILLVLMPLAGMVVANPYALANPLEFMRSLIQFSAPAGDLWGRTHGLLFGKMQHWDQALDGGFFLWAGSAYAVLAVAVLAVLARVERRAAIALATAVLVTAAMLLRTERHYGWYWFPAIVLLPMVLATIRGEQMARVAMGVAIAANLAVALPTISEQIESKRRHSANLNALPLVEACLARLAVGLRVDAVSEFAETAAVGGPRFATSTSDVVLRGFLSAPERPVYKGIDFFPIPPETLSTSRSLLFVLGDRLDATRPLRTPDGLRTALQGLSPHSWSVRHLGHCEFVDVLIAERGPG